MRKSVKQSFLALLAITCAVIAMHPAHADPVGAGGATGITRRVVAQDPTTAAGSDPAATIFKVQGDPAGTPIPVSSSPAAPTLAGPTTITSTQCLTLTNLQSQGAIMVDVSGTYTGTLVSHVKGAASSVVAEFRPRAQGVMASFSLVAQTGLFTINTAGATSVDVCGLTVASGGAVVSFRTNTGAPDSLDPLLLLPGSVAAPSVYAITVQPPNGSQTNSSTTVTTGGTFQTVVAAQPNRRSIVFQNICGNGSNCTAKTDNCELFIAVSGTPTVANTMFFPPGSGYSWSTGVIPPDAIQVTCDSSGDHFYLSVQ